MLTDTFLIIMCAAFVCGWMGFIICLSENRTLRRQVDRFQADVRRITDRCSRVNRELDDAEEHVAELTAHVSVLKSDLHESEEARIKADSERERLQNLLDGYGEHIKALDSRLTEVQNG